MKCTAKRTNIDDLSIEDIKKLKAIIEIFEDYKTLTEEQRQIMKDESPKRLEFVYDTFDELIKNKGESMHD